MINKVAVIGYGYWGTKLARKFHDLGVLKCVSDVVNSRVEEAHEVYRYLSFGVDSCDAVAIATPPETHYEVAKEALERDQHVFCEKPLATEWDQAWELEDLAIKKGLRLQVGHIYLYNSGLMAIPPIVSGAEIHIRLYNVGEAPSGSTREILWAGIPHALSVAVHLLGCPLQIGGVEFRGQGEDEPLSLRNLSRISVALTFNFLNSTCYIDVADQIGRRQRSISVASGMEQWIFNADHPNDLVYIDGKGRDLLSYEGEEPLMAECKDFLTGAVIKDHMGSKVVGGLCGIRDMIEGKLKELEEEAEHGEGES